MTPLPIFDAAVTAQLTGLPPGLLLEKSRVIPIQVATVQARRCRSTPTVRGKVDKLSPARAHTSQSSTTALLLEPTL